jgi:hypothetical protein
MESPDKTEAEKMNENDKLVDAYLAQMTPFQKTANEIAKRNLGSSYCIEKSIGFLDFKKTLTS